MTVEDWSDDDRSNVRLPNSKTVLLQVLVNLAIRTAKAWGDQDGEIGVAHLVKEPE